MNLRARYRPIALASNVLVITNFGVLIVLLLINDGFNLINIAIGSGVILVANLAFVASGVIAPSLVAPGKILFPLNITLPLVFSSWAAVVAFFTWRVGNPLEPTLSVFRRFADLLDPWELALFPLAQIATMSLVAASNARDAKKGEVESD